MSTTCDGRRSATRALAALTFLAAVLGVLGPAGQARAAVPFGYIPITATGEIVSRSGLCLDARNASHADGTPVQLYPCNGTAAQSWTLREKDLTVRALGACLTPKARALSNRTMLELDTCAPRAYDQQWSYVSAPAEHLFNGQSGLCLDIPGGKDVPRVQLQLYSCNWTDAQRWDVPGV